MAGKAVALPTRRSPRIAAALASAGETPSQAAGPRSKAPQSKASSSYADRRAGPRATAASKALWEARQRAAGMSSSVHSAKAPVQVSPRNMPLPTPARSPRTQKTAEEVFSESSRAQAQDSSAHPPATSSTAPVHQPASSSTAPAAARAGPSAAATAPEPTYSIGQRVFYWSRNHSKWVPMSIDDVNVEEKCYYLEGARGDAEDSVCIDGYTLYRVTADRLRPRPAAEVSKPKRARATTPAAGRSSKRARAQPEDNRLSVNTRSAVFERQWAQERLDLLRQQREAAPLAKWLQDHHKFHEERLEKLVSRSRTAQTALLEDMQRNAIDQYVDQLMDGNMMQEDDFCPDREIWNGVELPLDGVSEASRAPLLRAYAKHMPLRTLRRKGRPA